MAAAINANAVKISYHALASSQPVSHVADRAASRLRRRRDGSGLSMRAVIINQMGGQWPGGESGGPPATQQPAGGPESPGELDALGAALRKEERQASSSDERCCPKAKGSFNCTLSDSNCDVCARARARAT